MIGQTQTAEAYSIIYQAAKLGDIPQVLSDFALAHEVIAEKIPIGRVYGTSGGALAALTHCLVISVEQVPGHFAPQTANALEDFAGFLRRAKSWHIRRLNWWGMRYGFYNLKPLRRWLSDQLRLYTGVDNLDTFRLSDLAVPLYLCVQDRNGYPVFLGPDDESLQAEYHSCATRIEDAPVLDATMATLSTMLSTDAYAVNGAYYKDGRPVYADISAYVLDMEADDPRPIIKSRPHVPLPKWRSWAVSQPFIMHRWHEQNQAILAGYYNDLLMRQRALQAQSKNLVDVLRAAGQGELTKEHFVQWQDTACPSLRHVRLPYIGSTEVSANMRDNIAHKEERMETFRELSEPQLTGYNFSRPTTLIYGAGGFSGMLAGMATAALINERQGNIERIFGCSAGVLNGLFHGIMLAAQRHPELYTPAALDAMQHLEELFVSLTPKTVGKLNRTPHKLLRAVANLKPFVEQLKDYLQRWTGRDDVEQLTFEDIKLPFYVAGSRGSDGLTDFFGMPDGLQMEFAGRTQRPINCPIIDAVVAGMAQPFYITPPVIEGETYFDGGSTFYDFELLVASICPNLPSILSVHVVGPPDYSFGFDERPTILRIVFDTHNFTFPEERRRMTAISNLLYDHETLRRRMVHLVEILEEAGHTGLLNEVELSIPDTGWWQTWRPEPIGVWQRN